MKKKYREIVSDSLLIGGAAAVSYGVALLNLAAGIVIGGLLAIAYGWMIGMGGDGQ